MNFKASMDTFCLRMTIGIVMLLLFIGIKEIGLLLFVKNDLRVYLLHSGILIVIIATGVGCYIFSVNNYSINDNELIINRPIKNKIIKIADIVEIKTVDANDLSGTRRTFGNGGLFGYYGKYYNSKFGNMTWYVTQRRNRLLIETNQGKKIIISPDDVGLVDEVK